MTTAVDPSRAITELQPWQVNQEKVTQGLAGQTYKDIWGRDIKEPDHSNPTRARWERPLDTIRGFQESIDRGYRRSYYQDEPPASPGETNWGSSRVPPRGDARGDASTDSMYFANRTANSTTPLSNSSGDQEAFGAMGGRTALNDHMTMNRPGGNRTHQSFPSQDTGYASVDRGMDGETQYGNSNVNRPSPLQKELPQSAKPIALNSSAPVSPPAKVKEPKRKSWIGKKLSKKN